MIRVHHSLYRDDETPWTCYDATDWETAGPDDRHLRILDNKAAGVALFAAGEWSHVERVQDEDAETLGLRTAS